jgi:hypothetical protein
MKQHPDRQPSRAITMHGGDHDDRQANQDFEGGRIDCGTPYRVCKESRSSGEFIQGQKYFVENLAGNAADMIT